jgi:rare lipoprotein A
MFKGSKWLSVVLSVLFSGLLIQACSVLPVTEPVSVPAPQQPHPGQPKPYRVFGVWYHPIADASGYEEEGLASWYGEEFHGRKTSNGETYDMYGITAAHKTLPLGTWVRVHNLANNRTLDMRINDRGPFVKERIIDLSYGAAKALDTVKVGVAPVRVIALGIPVAQTRPGEPQQYAPVDYYHGNFTFQVGAFSERANAERFVQTLAQSYENAHLSTYSDDQRTFYRVRVGLKTDLQEAEAYEKYLKENGFPETFIVAE